MGYKPSTDYPGYEALSPVQKQKVLQSAIDQLVVRGAVAKYAPILWDYVELRSESLAHAWKDKVRRGRFGERDVNEFSPVWEHFAKPILFLAVTRAGERIDWDNRSEMVREIMAQLQGDVFDFLEEAAGGALSEPGPSSPRDAPEAASRLE
jgi:hypothetical protein